MAGWFDPPVKAGFALDMHQYGAMYIIKISVNEESAHEFFTQLEFHLNMMQRPEFIPKRGASPGRRYYGPTDESHKALVASKIYETFASETYKGR